MKELKDKILRRQALISVIGLGYVGLPLAIEFVKNGFCVKGIDIDEGKIQSLKRGESYILDVPDEVLGEALSTGRFRPYKSYKVVADCDVIIICVPTPLRKTGEPDLSYILDTTEEVKRYIKDQTLVILESTTYPGTTEEIILPILSQDGRKVGKDFYLAFSPERIDPGSKEFNTANIPKVIGGVTKKCLSLAATLYQQIVKEVVPVSSPKVAEMVKLLENSFRSVNIALANETALICSRLGIDVWEVIEAARTKPFGFMAFYPGPGIGGHCIPSDPMYLVWKAKLAGYEPKLIKVAQEVNLFMPQYVVDKVLTALNLRGKSVKGARVLILGVTYKPDVNDIRESPALEIMRELRARGARLYYYDPYIKELKFDAVKFKSIVWNERNIKRMDCVVLVTNHKVIDYKILKKAKLVVDTRNAINWKARNIVKI